MTQPTQRNRICNMLFGVFAFPLVALVLNVELWKAGVLFGIAGAFWWHLSAFLFPKAVEEWYRIQEEKENYRD